ncbi:MAG: hypothetical protein NTW95_12045 [Candidatus Aminicenantes bacterium]|nr:hypothetical protein [Candidatus Aminicenantes bacterium]
MTAKGLQDGCQAEVKWQRTFTGECFGDYWPSLISIPRLRRNLRVKEVFFGPQAGVVFFADIQGLEKTDMPGYYKEGVFRDKNDRQSLQVQLLA